MIEPSTPRDAPIEVVISDEVMNQIQHMPPDAVDGLAAAISELRQNPTGPGTLPLVPVPVDHSPGRPRTYVPATRSASYLRNAVAEISPETVAHFDNELQEMTRFTPERGKDGQVVGLRMFTTRWVEYIAVQGDHDTARHINDSENGEELAERFGQAMRRVHTEYFPDAGTEPGAELGVQTLPQPGRGFVAVCPVTQLRAQAPTEGEAQARLRGMLLEWITG
jgi:hypothetical protein